MRLVVAQPDELDAVEARAVDADGARPKWEDVAGFVSWENELDVLDALEGMLHSKLRALQQGAAAGGGAAAADGVRPEVARMVEVYRQGASLSIHAVQSLRLER